MLTLNNTDNKRDQTSHLDHGSSHSATDNWTERE